ncbi:MAG TPA: DUF1684 domain-containing protein [Streptosporangiaceae bacterium]|nr:DUF1684 domain-containing protein [Streptosporangiaceae bacterium]
MTIAELDLADWRRRVAELYAAIRADDDPERAHARWRSVRDELIGKHPQSPVLPGDPLRAHGLPYWPYDPALRFELPLRPAEPASLTMATDGGNSTGLKLIGRVEVPAPVDGSLDVWWLRQYAGGLFVPVRDGTAGQTSYGGGRYLLDTAKGADLGGGPDTLVIDLNFLYHPSCRYNPAWQCPLAPPGNTVRAPIRAGERL